MNLNWHNYPMNKVTDCTVAGVFISSDSQTKGMTWQWIISRYKFLKEFKK